MAELLSAVQELIADDTHMGALARRVQLPSADVATSVFESSVPVAIEGLAAQLNTASDADELLALARGYRWAERNQPALLFTNPDNSIAEELTRRTFGNELDALVEAHADEADVSELVALEVLEVAVGVVVLSALEVSGGTAADASLDPILVESTGHEAEPLASSPDQAPAPEQQAEDAPEPTTSGSAAAEPSPTETSAPSPATAPHTEVAVMAENQEAGNSRRGPVLLVLLMLGFVAGGVILTQDGGAETELLSTEGGDDVAADDSESVGEDDADADADGQDGSAPSDGVTDSGSDDGDALPAVDVTTPEVEQDSSPIISYSIPMRDDINETNEAAGTLSFDFNVETGEVCYSVHSASISGPYRSHIHVGRAGEKGGIVVDLGPLESGAVGCLENHPADTRAILDDRAGHYAELHDLSEEWTIRGQLSDAIEDVEATISFEVGSGGAYTIIDGATIVLEGDVSDSETASGLQALLSQAGQPIVNRLNITPDAPLPSGRVFLADATFVAGSFQAPAISEGTQEALRVLLESKEGWSITAVGRTDGLGSELDNLELSLKRAQSLRDLLAEAGIPNDAVRVRGAGELDANSQQSEASALNRRAEFEFVPGN